MAHPMVDTTVKNDVKPFIFSSVDRGEAEFGVFAARAFANPAAFNRRTVSLAEDELTLAQTKNVFKDNIGYDMPETYGLVGSGIRYKMKKVGIMFNWFKNVGYIVDIQALRKEEPRLQDFGMWL